MLPHGARKTRSIIRMSRSCGLPQRAFCSNEAIATSMFMNWRKSGGCGNGFTERASERTYSATVEVFLSQWHRASHRVRLMWWREEPKQI